MRTRFLSDGPGFFAYFKLKEVYLAPTISHIVNYAFRYCTALSLISICRNEAIMCESDAFLYASSNIAINVPKKSLITGFLSFTVTKAYIPHCIFLNKECTKFRQTKRFSITSFLIYQILISI